MAVPVTDIVQSARVHGVDLGLLAFAVWLVESAPPPVARPRSRRFAQENVLPVDPGKELTASFLVPEAKLAMPCEMLKDGRFEMDQFAGGADWIMEHSRPLLPQTAHAIARQSSV